VNGLRLKSGEKAKLNAEDDVCFGQVKTRFHVW
jgi:hypothetical protein